MKSLPGMNMRFTGKTEEKNGAKFADVVITFNGEKIGGFVDGGTISYTPTDAEATLRAMKGIQEVAVEGTIKVHADPDRVSVEYETEHVNVVPVYDSGPVHPRLSDLASAWWMYHLDGREVAPCATCGSILAQGPGGASFCLICTPRATAVVKPTVGKLKAWAAKHASGDRYCKAGPWRDADVHVYRVMRCPCGDKFIWSESEEKASPADYEL